jgi:transcriptional regulator with XRE-family HTH domain
LAKLTGLTERQLTKIETTHATPIPEATVDRLAAALGVPAPTLTGHLALIEDDLQQEQKSSCTSGCCG